MRKRLLAAALGKKRHLLLRIPQQRDAIHPETAVGMGGDVVVEMTFDANSITDVKVTGDQETPGIGTMAISVVLNSTAKSRTARLLLPRWRISIILPLAVW